MFYEFDKKRVTTAWSMSNMHRHKHFELYYLLEGTRTMFIENTMYTIPAHSFVLIPPFVLHKTEGQSFTRININYSEDYLSEADNDVFTKYLAKKIITLPENTLTKVGKILAKMNEYSLQKNNADSAVFTRCLIYELLYVLCDYAHDCPSVVHDTPKGVRPVIVTKILDYINNHLNEELSIRSIANQFYISDSYLCKLFHKYIGISVNQTIINLRITKVCQLLTDTKKNINEISETCGFSSPNYLGLIFKKHIGLSPMNYRKYQREKRG